MAYGETATALLSPLSEERSSFSNRNRYVAMSFLLIVILFMALTLSFSMMLLHKKDDSLPEPQSDKYPKGCLWVGHLAPDTDSYCTAMAAAEIFDGIYSISAAPNRETQFVVERFGFPTPPLFIDQYHDDIPCIGLVDHNQKSQSPLEYYDLPREKLAVIIDHHAVQSETMTVESIIHIDVRPWGSTSTLLYETYLYSFRSPSQGVAQCMLSAILSDTIGLSSPTTTPFDILYTDYLAETAQVENTTELYLEMGTAKSDISGYSTTQVVEFDGKEFEFVWASGENCLVYWSTLETFTPEDVITDPNPYLQAMIEVKAENNYDLIYFSVVNSLGTFMGDTTNLSTLLLIGSPETQIAMGTYDQPDFDETQSEMDLSPRVSRKKEFIPPLDYYISHTNRSVHFSSPSRSSRKSQGQKKWLEL